MMKTAVINILIVASIMAVTKGASSETYFEWKIGGFFDMPVEKRYDSDSPKFSLGNGHFIITVHIEGKNSDNGGSVAVYVKLKDSVGEHPIEFTIGFKKPNGEEILSYKTSHTFTPESFTWGWARFMDRATLQKAATEGPLTVFCKARITNSVEDIPEFTSSNGTGNLSENFKNLYTSKRYSDVKLNVKSKEFSAHKNVLSCRLNAFASMNIPNKVEITDVDSDSFEEFLLFVYTGQLVKVSSKKAMSLYRTADKYSLPELKEKCARSIAEHDLNVRSFYDILDFANLQNDKILLTAVADFLLTNGKRILSTERWETFLDANPSKVNKLLLSYAEKK